MTRIDRKSQKSAKSRPKLTPNQRNQQNHHPNRSQIAEIIKITAKNDPKIAPKIGRKMDPILRCSLTNFGTHFGAQNWWTRGVFFSCFSEWLQSPLLAPPLPGLSWAHLGPLWSPLGPIFASFWPHLGHLGLSWRPLGFFLALSWPS